MKKCMTAVVCLAHFIGLIQIPVYASEDIDKTIFQVSRNAGSGGVRCYDSLTNEETYYSPELYYHGDAEPIPASPELQLEQPEMSPRHVIGHDSRVKVLNPSGAYESTCLIGSRFKNISSGEERVGKGTGWLLNDKYVMTAGHMLYVEEDGVVMHCGIFIGASDGKHKRYRLGYKYHVAEDYVNHCENDIDYYNFGMYDDWGIIELVSPVDVSISKLGRYAVNSAYDMEGQYYHTQGYPEDLNLAAGKTGDAWNLWYMYQTAGYIQKDRPGLRFLDLVETDIDAYHGQSGSPVYSYRTGYGYCAEGMIVAQSKSYDGEPKNFIILLNDWLFDYIKQLP